MTFRQFLLILRAHWITAVLTFAPEVFSSHMGT